jgi:hypothetical protein
LATPFADFADDFVRGIIRHCEFSPFLVADKRMHRFNSTLDIVFIQCVHLKKTTCSMDVGGIPKILKT